MKHSDNKNIKALYLQTTEYLLSGLNGIQNEEQTFPVSEKQKYAHDVCARVFEIDNAFQNLDLTIEYLKISVYPESEFDFSAHHSFHVENFLLRLTSVVDRCYLLAGSTVLLANKSIENNGGNREVLRELKTISPNGVKILGDLEKAIKPLRPLRNQVAHNNGYTNKNLLAVSMIGNSTDDIKEKFTEIMSIESLKEIVINDSISLLEPILPIVNGLVTDLINELAKVYIKLIESNT